MATKKLAETISRELRKAETYIKNTMEQQRGTMHYIVALTEEPGEVLITRQMSEEQIAEAAAAAVSEVFPGKKVSNVYQYNIFVEFTIS